MSWKKNDLKPKYRLYKGDIDGARKLACKIIKEDENIYPKVVIRSKTNQGEVNADRKNNVYDYISTNSKDGIYWRVNPKTGKLTSKLGYVD